MKKIGLILIVLFLGVGCSKEEKNKNLETVDLVLDWYPNAIHSFIYTAIEKGYFSDEGLDINVRFPSTPQDPISLTAAGKADIGIYYMHEVIMKKTNEQIPVKSIGAIIKKPVNVVISPKSENIYGPKDLVGKKIGYAGSLYNEILIKNLLKTNGENPDSVKLVDVGFELLTAMITNQVDATIGGVINHEVPVMEEKGIDINYFTPEEYGLPNHYGFIFISGDEVIKTKSETLKKFLRAANKGMEYVKKYPEESIDIVLKNQQQESFPLSKYVENKSINILLPMISKENNDYFSQEDKIWDKNIQWLLEEKLIDRKLDTKNFYINLLD